MSTFVPLSYPFLTTTNAVPLPHEATLVRERVEDLECQHSQLSELLTLTQSQLRDVASQIKSLKSILSAVRKLPLEVLGEIFLRVTPTSKTRPSSYQKALVKLPLVCRTWRDAAYLTPRLWCEIWIRADAPSISYQYLSAWASRSGSLPKNLEISLCNCGGVDWPNGEINTDICGQSRCLFANPIFAKLLKRTPGSWASVALNCPTRSCLRNFVAELERVDSQKMPDPWNTVESFTLIATKWDRWIDPVDPRSLKSLSFIPNSATKLCLHLPVENPDGEDEIPVWRWPFHIQPVLLQRLTSLELELDCDHILASPLLTALSQCGYLQTLTIDFQEGFLKWGGDDTARDSFEETGILLPKLQYVHFRQLCGTSFKVLRLLKMPNLCEVSLSFNLDATAADADVEMTAFSLTPEIDDYDDVVSLTDFIRGDRGLPSGLQSMHLKNASFHKGAMFHLLRDLHSLSYIKFEYVSAVRASGDFSSLSNPDTTPECLPNLTSIEVLYLQSYPDVALPGLRTFAEQRGINLRISRHNPYEWSTKECYRYLVGLPSDSEEE